MGFYIYSKVSKYVEFVFGNIFKILSNIISTYSDSIFDTCRLIFLVSIYLLFPKNSIL